MDRPVGYLVHNLNDPAVERRVELLQRAGLGVQLAGFYRERGVTHVADQPAQALQRSHDGRLAHRAGLLLGNLVQIDRLRQAMACAQVLLARNLEMLLLAVRVRRPDQRLVYESLDIHRLLFARTALGRAIRMLERSLLQHCDSIVTSSPAFIEHHFRAVQGFGGAIALVENKLASAACHVTRTSPGPGQPWKIGWFGMLRCGRSLDILERLVRAYPGRIEVHVAGIPAYRELPAFDVIMANTPGMVFKGRYTARELPMLYAGVHFAWCVDHFEAGLNSNWLLPNRLYESIACGCVPLAARDVETGAWLARNQVGVRFAEPEWELPAFLARLTPASYAALKQQVIDLPQDRVAETASDAEALAACLIGRAA